MRKTTLLCVLVLAGKVGGAGDLFDLQRTNRRDLPVGEVLASDELTDALAGLPR